MLSRWFAGFMVFALGFGCSELMKVAPAGASQGGEVESGLEYYDNGDEYELINTGNKGYLLAIYRKPGTPAVEPLFGSKSGTAVISKEDLDGVNIFRLVPVAALDPAAQPGFRWCMPGPTDCPIPDPEPPPMGVMSFMP